MNKVGNFPGFAGFQYPKFAVFLPKGTPRERLAKHKQRRKQLEANYPGAHEAFLSKGYEVSPYRSDKPLMANDGGRGFYLASDFAPGLRWKYCDDVDGARIDHTGWFTDDHQCDKIRGVVFRLPHRKGFLAGWTMGESMASTVEYDIYDDEIQAAYNADRLAERIAEAEREFNQCEGCLEAEATETFHGHKYCDQCYEESKATDDEGVDGEAIAQSIAETYPLFLNDQAEGNI